MAESKALRGMDARFDEGYGLPAGYGDNRIVLLVRDPYWVHCYWEVTPAMYGEAYRVFGAERWQEARKILRVYDVTGVDFRGDNANSFRDIGSIEGQDRWTIEVGVPGRSYCVDIGMLGADGFFLVLARSNIVETPRDTFSPVIDEEWMVTEEDFLRLYAMAEGLRPGASPGGAGEAGWRVLRSSLSGGMSGMSGSGRMPARSREEGAQTGSGGSAPGGRLA